MAVEVYSELRAILAECGADRALIERVCEGVCARLGGERHYIGKRWRAPEVQTQDSPAAIQRRNGVSRRTAYRWVDAWKGG